MRFSNATLNALAIARQSNAMANQRGNFRATSGHLDPAGACQRLWFGPRIKIPLGVALRPYIFVALP